MRFIKTRPVSELNPPRRNVRDYPYFYNNPMVGFPDAVTFSESKYMIKFSEMSWIKLFPLEFALNEGGRLVLCYFPGRFRSGRSWYFYCYWLRWFGCEPRKIW